MSETDNMNVGGDCGLGYCMASGSKPKILVSACLLGVACRYDGASRPKSAVQQLHRHFTLIKVCPETYGGLPIPRVPSERVAGVNPAKVVAQDGADRTAEFVAGTAKTLEVAQANDVKLAVLKAKSPSCGVHHIYDGTFTGTLVEGQGVTAQALVEAGITVLDENDVAAMTPAQLLALAR